MFSNLLSEFWMSGIQSSIVPFSQRCIPPPGKLFQFKRNTGSFLFIPTVVRSDLSIWSNIIKSIISGLPIHPSSVINELVDMRIRRSRNKPLPWPALLRRRAVLCTLHLLSSWRSPGSVGHSTLYSTPRTVKGTRIAAKISTLETIRIQLRFLAFPDLLKGSTEYCSLTTHQWSMVGEENIWRTT